MLTNPYIRAAVHPTERRESCDLPTELILAFTACAWADTMSTPSASVKHQALHSYQSVAPLSLQPQSLFSLQSLYSNPLHYCVLSTTLFLSQSFYLCFLSLQSKALMLILVPILSVSCLSVKNLQLTWSQLCYPLNNCAFLMVSCLSHSYLCFLQCFFSIDFSCFPLRQIFHSNPVSHYVAQAVFELTAILLPQLA